MTVIAGERLTDEWQRVEADLEVGLCRLKG
jgi:hypothetical protein